MPCSVGVCVLKSVHANKKIYLCDGLQRLCDGEPGLFKGVLFEITVRKGMAEFARQKLPWPVIMCQRITHLFAHLDKCCRRTR
jgi:hypothetical protein